jgi:hypothetical protein
MKLLARSAAVPITLIAAMSLAACGNASATITSTTAATNDVAYLCQVLPRVDRLIVTRRAHGSHFKFSFPAVVTVTNAALARKVATSACGQPAVREGEHCPAEFAVSYHLDFAVRGEKGLGGEAINVYPTGCETVTGLGAVRTTAEHHIFFRLLGNAMGVRNAGYFTFAGIVELG